MTKAEFLRRAKIISEQRPMLEMFKGMPQEERRGFIDLLQGFTLDEIKEAWSKASCKPLNSDDEYIEVHNSLIDQLAPFAEPGFAERWLKIIDRLQEVEAI